MEDFYPKQQLTEKPKVFSKRARIFSKVKRRFLKHVWLARLTILAAVLISLYLIVLIINLIFRTTGMGNTFKFAQGFVFIPKDKIESQAGRTNVLILGKAGAGHDAPDLTDTIIFASFSHDNPSVTLVSLPRDIWIPSLRAKLNSVYYWGNQKEPGGGIVLVKSTVEEVVGQPIHYGVVLDFNGFTELINTLGGVEVEVETAFVDRKYPIPGRENDDCGGDKEYRCRYETVRFEKGLQKMDGETALKFVRSRNAEGDEGTDIARAARQQKILVALKQKLLGPRNLLSPRKILGMLTVFQESVETDIEGFVGAILTKRALQAKGRMNSFVLSEDFLINPPISPRYDNLYVFVPKKNNWAEVHQWIDEILP